MESYQVREFNLSGLKGISDRTLEVHFGLYAGYVKNTNLLNERLAEIRQRGIGERKIEYSELARRLGFEYNGMVLHEYYFENMKGDGGGEPNGTLRNVIEASFGSVASWRVDFAATGTLRGIGWTIAYLDPSCGRISNHWVAEHEIGNVAGFRPVLVMDVWEHAYLLDYAPAERSKYIDAFLANVDWEVVGRRIES